MYSCQAFIFGGIDSIFAVEIASNNISLFVVGQRVGQRVGHPWRKGLWIHKLVKSYQYEGFLTYILKVGTLERSKHM